MKNGKLLLVSIFALSMLVSCNNTVESNSVASKESSSVTEKESVQVSVEESVSEAGNKQDSVTPSVTSIQPSVEPSTEPSVEPSPSVVEEDDFTADAFTTHTSYYSSIDTSLLGTDLLKQLQTLNGKKRSFTPGYKQLWNYYNKTDYDPNNSSKYIAFYRGTSATKGEMNKEHVWPNSRGGNLVEADIHMPRPTLTSDNSDRGNSFYVEGKVSTSAGWDPLAAGMTENYRGISARIIFYCCVANSTLSLVDKENDATSNKTMGKLSDLLKWNLAYDIDPTETRRNDGAESIQGNRNPFIDNPSLACAIWGGTNATTKQICGQAKKQQRKSSKKINTSYSENELLVNHFTIDAFDCRQYKY